MFLIVHRSREGQRHICDEDEIRVVERAGYHDVLIIAGGVLRRMIEHHLAGVALQQQLAADTLRRMPSPYYRRPLDPVPPIVQDTRALARRARKRAK